MRDLDLARMDPKARRFLAMVAVGAKPPSHVSAEERRRSFEQLMRFSKPPSAVLETSDHLIASGSEGIPVRLYSPPSVAGALPGLIYFHGGGLVAGSIDTHDALCRALTLEVGCRIFSIGYRLAPEHPFPSAILDAFAAARWVKRHAGNLAVIQDRIAIGGDSGGGTLAAIVAQVLGRRLALRAQLLLCPVLDFAEIRPSRDAYADGFLLDRATMERDLADYAPRRQLADPRISPLHAASLAGLPRAIIHTAGFDPLRDEGEAFALALQKAGVELDYTCHETLIHHFYALTGAIPAAATALSAIAADVRRALF